MVDLVRQPNFASIDPSHCSWKFSCSDSCSIRSRGCYLRWLYCQSLRRKPLGLEWESQLVEAWKGSPHRRWSRAHHLLTKYKFVHWFYDSRYQSCHGRSWKHFALVCASEGHWSWKRSSWIPQNGESGDASIVPQVWALDDSWKTCRKIPKEWGSPFAFLWLDRLGDTNGSTSYLAWRLSIFLRMSRL